jgi:hypothetical protein
MYIYEGKALFWAAQLTVCVIEGEADGTKKIALATAIPPDNDILAGMQRANDGLVAIRLEAVDGQLLDVHFGGNPAVTN